MQRRSILDLSEPLLSLRVIAIPVVSSLLLVGCSTGGDPEVVAVAETSGTDEPATSVDDDEGVSDGGMEFNVEGLIPIPPGTGTTRVFVPTFEYTVPPGWFTTGEELERIDVIQQLEPSARVISVRRLAEETVDEMVERLVEEPGWELQNDVLESSLGNRDAKQLDGVATERFTVYEDFAGNGLLADPGDRLRVLLAPVDGWTLLVVVAASVEEFDSFAAEATTLLDTVKFVPGQGPET